MRTKNNRIVDDKYNSKNYPRLYKIWAGLKYRCNNSKAENYQYYGGKGITYCYEWERFAPFCKWALENGYADNLTLDRKDSNKNYCPENCRWSSAFEQANNRKTNVNYSYNNETHTLSEWSKIFDLNYATVLTRYANGKRGSELFKPTRQKRQDDRFENIKYSDATLSGWTKKKLILYIHNLYEIAESMKGGK